VYQPPDVTIGHVYRNVWQTVAEPLPVTPDTLEDLLSNAAAAAYTNLGAWRSGNFTRSSSFPIILWIALLLTCGLLR